MTAKPRKPLLVNMTWAVVALTGLALLYVLSYAPVYKLLRQPNSVLPNVPGYSPVEWLIDNTPLSRLLFWWADLWGMKEDFQVASGMRIYEEWKHP